MRHASHALFGDYSRDTSFRAPAKWAIFVIALFSSQAFFVKGANPFGVHYVQELFLIALGAYAVAYAFRKGQAMSKVDGFILLFAGLLVGLSAAFSWIEYGQPLFYGVFESRVTLMTLAYFPLKDLIGKSKERMIFALDCIVYLAFFFFALGVMLKIGVFSVADYYQFGTSDLSSRGNLESAEILRGDRLATGRFFVIFATIYALTMFIQKAQRFWTIAAFVLLMHIVFILQERQTMAGVGIVLAFLLASGFRSRGMKRGAVIACFGGIGLIIFGYFQSDIFSAQAALLENTLAADFEALARFETAYTMLDNMNLGLGHGALSLLWQGGFHQIYSPRFFIGDAGILGTVFRLGVIPGFAMLGYAVFFCVSRTRRLALPGARKLVWAMLLYLAVTAITSAPFEYLGNFLAVMFLIMDAVGSRRSVRRSGGHRHQPQHAPVQPAPSYGPAS